MDKKRSFTDYKLIMVYLNEAQKSRLEDFFEEIKFFYYAVEKRIETVWSEKLKHKNSTVWPGTDCIFLLTLPEDEVGKMLKYLKTFRMALPEGVAMGIGIVPIERVIPRLYYDDTIEVYPELLEKLKIIFN